MRTVPILVTGLLLAGAGCRGEDAAARTATLPSFELAAGQKTATLELDRVP
jgi:hypothetical protein